MASLIAQYRQIIEKTFGSSVCLIFVNFFDLERTNQLNLLPDKDLVCLCHPIEP